jgi:hypothetical protein
MANPNPVRTQAVIDGMFKAVSDLPLEPLSKKDARVMLGESVHESLYSLPQRDRINLMRQAVTDAVWMLRNLPEVYGYLSSLPQRDRLSLIAGAVEEHQRRSEG